MGFEAAVTFEPLDRIAVKAGVDYVNAQDTKSGVPLPFTPLLRGILSLTYRDAAWSGILEWRLAAAQNRLGDGDTPTAGYGVVNCGTGVRISSGGLVHVLSMHCDNLFDSVYRDNLSVIKDFIPGPGFRLAYDLLF